MADAGGHHHAVQIGDEVGERHRRAQAHGEALRGFEILQHIVDPPRRRQVEAGHLAHELLQDAAVGAPARERCGNALGIDAGIQGQARGFGYGHEIAGAEHLIDELGRLPRA